MLHDQSWLVNPSTCTVPLDRGAPECSSEWIILPSWRDWADHHTRKPAGAWLRTAAAAFCPSNCARRRVVFIMQAPNCSNPKKSSVRKYELNGLESCFRPRSGAPPVRGILGENERGGNPAASRVTRCAFQLTSELRLLAQIGPTTRLLAVGPQETRLTGGWDGPGRSWAITDEGVETGVDPLDCISGR